MKDSFLFLAHGFEEIEALTPVDLLRRAGIPVKTVSITDALQVEGAHGVSVTADALLADTDFDGAPWLILPGGMPGAENLYNCGPLRELLRRQASTPAGRIAAICASPAVVLGQLGLLRGRKATCYPGCEKLLGGATSTNTPVTVDDRYVLGNGPATAMHWALTIISETLGANQARDVAAGLLYYPAKTDAVDFTFG